MDRVFTVWGTPTHAALAQVTGGTAGGDEGEEEPYYDPSWPHLQVGADRVFSYGVIDSSGRPYPPSPPQVVYEFLLRFIVSPEVRGWRGDACGGIMCLCEISRRHCCCERASTATAAASTATAAAAAGAGCR